MRRSVIVDTTARLVLHSALVLSIYLLFAGHNQPGGGFVGGLVAGAAVTLIYVAGGIEDVRTLSRLKPWTVLGSGLMIAGGAALVPLVLGGSLLEGDHVTVDLPVFGDVKVTSALLFDIGVYGVVLGLVLMVFEAFGEEREPGVDVELADEPDASARPGGRP
ncbi:MAG TPA: MnhB domain-containing protein [Acidimicrobiales bacterium]